MSKILVKKENLLIGSLFLFIFSVFFFSSLNKYETDIFWIIKGGEWILNNHQIPHQDLWSYTMSSYPWVFHEWASGIMMYILHSKVGDWSLALLSSFIVTLALFFE